MSTLESRIAELLAMKLDSLVSAQVATTSQEDRIALDASTIPQFTEELPIPAVYDPVIERDCGKTTHAYAVDVSEFQQQILPEGYPTTTVYGYGGVVKDPETGECTYKRSVPGATFEVFRGQRVTVRFMNRLVKPHIFAVDPTLHWANPNNMPDPSAPFLPFPPGYPQAQFPTPIVTHLHGGENPSVYDGHPNAWFTAGEERGSAFVTSEMIYENTQPSATLWYHDHTMGITRLNVVAGMAGFYLLRDPKDAWESMKSYCGFTLPRGEYEIPIVIQDRMFYTDGSINYPEEGTVPSLHPYWVPGYIGDCIVVNGKVWPRLSVKPTWYRFRLLNGSNERVYNLSFENKMAFWVIGSDSGYLPHPVQLTSLLIAPGERYDVLVDFSFCADGQQILLKNDANAPYPGGESVVEATTARIMRFDVVGTRPLNVVYLQLPRLSPLPRLSAGIRTRLIVLNAQTDENDQVTMMTLNGLEWMMHPTETPLVGSTEDWYIINVLGGAHPIHLHLVPFQVISRQSIDGDAYSAKWQEINGSPPIMHHPQPVPYEPYVTGPVEAPALQESGWKDTVLVNAEQVLHLRVRFAPETTPTDGVKPGENLFPFDPSAQPGYVWHCHILDHEDNEMMRPLIIKSQEENT